MKNTREVSGLTIEEVSKDLNIPPLILMQIEEGSIGVFKNIFELKDYLSSYAKYLGLNQDEIIDEFNEFMFEKTSKIPMDEIEAEVKKNANIEANDERVASPYTKSVPIVSSKQFIISLIVIFILVVLAVIWSIKQITVSSTTTDVLNYFVR